MTIYDRALTLSEVSAIHHAAGDGKCPSTAPVAVDDARQATEDTTLVVAASSLLANDCDPDGDELTLTQVTGGPATHGTVALAGGQVTYMPAADFNGPASFDYTVSDGLGHSATATVAVTVGEVNDDPAAVADAKSVTGRALTFPAADLTLERQPRARERERADADRHEGHAVGRHARRRDASRSERSAYTADAGLQRRRDVRLRGLRRRHDRRRRRPALRRRRGDGDRRRRPPARRSPTTSSLTTDEDDAVGVTLSATVAERRRR